MKKEQSLIRKYKRDNGDWTFQSTEGMGKGLPDYIARKDNLKKWIEFKYATNGLRLSQLSAAQLLVLLHMLELNIPVALVVGTQKKYIQYEGDALLFLLESKMKESIDLSFIPIHTNMQDSPIPCNSYAHQYPQP